MVTALKFAVVSAIFLLPFAYPSSALSPDLVSQLSGGRLDV